MSEIHYIKNARNEKSTFDLSWTLDFTDRQTSQLIFLNTNKVIVITNVCREICWKRRETREIPVERAFPTLSRIPVNFKRI